MRRLRRGLSWIVSAWLLCQASTVAVLSASACIDEPAAETAIVCSCAHAPGADCPMHHSSNSSTPRCSCRSADDGASGVLALLGAPAVVPPQRAGSRLASISTVSEAPDAGRADYSFVPDPPPPRRPLR
jgi:hypothetical protein